MSEKKDKKKVLVETFDDERIKTFLLPTPYGDVNADFYVLEKAYRGMNEENFASFVRFFVEAGRNLNAQNPQGLTMAQIIGQHYHGVEYLAALRAAGAGK